MDTSGEELGRIVAFVNRRPWIMEDPTAYDSSSSSSSISGARKGVTAATTIHDSNYFLDRMGTSELGDTSLHRICAWHASPQQFRAFLDHMEEHTHAQQHHQQETNDNATMVEAGEHNSDMDVEMESTSLENGTSCYEGMPSPPHLNQTNDTGVTALHIAVYRNAFHVQSMVEMLLQRLPSLASQQMTCGSTPLHILCAHNITIRKEVLDALLKADPSAVLKEDINGDTPLSLLWKNVLRFRWARSDHVALENDDEDEETEDSDSDDNSNEWYAANGIRRRRQRPRRSWMTVISPDQYIDLSLRMVRAAKGKTQHDSLTLADICSMPRCPPLLVRLVLQHYNKLIVPCKLASTPLAFGTRNDDTGMTALHYATQQTTTTMQFVPAHVLTVTQSVVDCLLDHYPWMVWEQDYGGRLALHYALEKNVTGCHTSGTHMEELRSFYASLYRLVKANPDSLRVKDPVTGLYPFALLAASTRSCAAGVSPFHGKSNASMEVEYESPRLEKDLVEDLVHLGATFRLLRRFPEAAIYRD